MKIIFIAVWLLSGAFSQRGKPDLILIGNFMLESCSLRVVELRYLLNSASQFLQPLSTLPPDPKNITWLSFFGRSDIPSVIDVYSRMRIGGSVIIAGIRRKPQLVCITSRQNPFRPSCQRQPSLTAAQIAGTQFILLCPLFFNLRFWPAVQVCGRTNAAKTQFLEGPSIGDTQYTTLVHELAHLYLPEGGLNPEARGANMCINLPAGQKAINPSNYAFYAGNILAGCKNFPNQDTWPDRELLAQGPEGPIDLLNLTLQCGSQDGEENIQLCQK